MTLHLVSSRDVTALAIRNRREEIAKAARAILRSAALHTDDAILEACQALRDWGDATDHMQADAMTLAIRNRDRNRARRPKRVIRWDEVAVFLSAGFAIVMIAVAGWAG